MKERGKIFGQLGRIFESKRIEAQQDLLRTLQESSFFGMYSKYGEVSLVKNALSFFHNSETVRRSLGEFGISAQETAEQYYILRYIDTAAEVGNIQDKLTNSVLARPERTKLQKQLSNNTKALLALEEELQDKPQRRSVLPQNLKELRLSREEIENARQIAESEYRLAQQAGKYLLDDERTAIPALPPEKALIKVPDDRGVIPIKDFLEEVPQEHLDSEAYDYHMVRDIRRASMKSSGDLDHHKAILFSKLGLAFDNLVFDTYAMLYIYTMASIQTIKSLPNELFPEKTKQLVITAYKQIYNTVEERVFLFHEDPGLSRDQIMETRKRVEEAFRLHPEAFAANNPTDQQELYY